MQSGEVAEPAEGTGLLNLRRGDSTEGSNPSLSAFLFNPMTQQTQMIVRFAPSPTGYLHVGGARTAIFNYLLAQKNHGLFRLRIEDTDQERSSESMTQSILESLQWLGIPWDGEIVLQSANQSEHQSLCETLLANGSAYRCFCTREELAARRSCGEGVQAYMYDRKCRHLPETEIRTNLDQNKSYVIRFKVPEGSTTFHDLVHGDVTVQHEEIDDFVIQRSNGSPVYQIAVVFDDHAMGITHVIRGDDHLSNTPKQILIYKAIGWEVPQFGHVPLILGPDQKRLSKRHGATAIESYRENGYCPEAMFNFLTLLGWSPGDDREIMSLAELIKVFSIEKISSKAAVFDENKLLWMNSQIIQNKSAEALLPDVWEILQKQENLSAALGNFNDSYILAFIRLMQPRVKTLNEFKEADYFFIDPEEFDHTAVEKHWKDGIQEKLEILIDRLDSFSIWDETSIETVIRQLAEECGIGAGKLIHPVRLVLTGKSASPGLFELMVLLGKETVIRRLKRAIQTIPSH